VSVHTDIADAMVVMLNAASLVQTFTAARWYIPRYDKEDLAGTLAVRVAPASLSGALVDRAGTSDNLYGVDVGMQKLFDASERATINTELDPLSTFVDAVVALFFGKSIGNTNSVCIEFDNDPIFSPDAFEGGEFRSVVRFTMRKFI